MPGADSGGAFGGVSNLKLIFGKARREAGTDYVSFVAEKNERYFSIWVYILLSVAAAVLSLASWLSYSHSYL